MTGQRCESCQFWNRVGAVAGECREQSPNLDQQVPRLSGARRQWPLTLPADWCRQWKERGPR